MPRSGTPGPPASSRSTPRPSPGPSRHKVGKAAPSNLPGTRQRRDADANPVQASFSAGLAVADMTSAHLRSRSAGRRRAMLRDEQQPPPPQRLAGGGATSERVLHRRSLVAKATILSAPPAPDAVQPASVASCQCRMKTLHPCRSKSPRSAGQCAGDTRHRYRAPGGASVDHAEDDRGAS